MTEWFSKLQVTMKQHHPDDIYNDDETGILYNATRQKLESNKPLIVTGEGGTPKRANYYLVRLQYEKKRQIASNYYRKSWQTNMFRKCENITKLLRL